MSSLAVFSLACLAAVLTADETTAHPGQHDVDVPISVYAEPAEEVSGVQFDMAFDGAAFSVARIELGAAAEAADKTFYTNVLDANTVRVIITGANQLVIPDGDVAISYFDVAGNASAETYPIELTNVMATDPFGFRLDVEIIAGAIHIAGTEGEGEGEGPPPGPTCIGGMTRGGPFSSRTLSDATGNMLLMGLLAATLLTSRRRLRCLEPLRGGRSSR